MPGADRRMPAFDPDAAFGQLACVPCVLIALSGGSDSVALTWLMQRWRKALPSGPALYAATVDHGLRSGSHDEAVRAGGFCATLDIPHTILSWSGEKPATGIQEAAREARYHLLAAHARAVGASHIVTGHTGDDQMETVMMRLLRGSGLKGLGGMRAVSGRYGLQLMRPLLGAGREELRALLRAADIGWIDDPGNESDAFLRVRLRRLLPKLMAEGLERRRLGHTALRLQQADEALEALAQRFLATNMRHDGAGRVEVPREAYGAEPVALRQRILQGLILLAGGGEGELARIETLDARIADMASGQFRVTIAGAIISVGSAWLRVSAEDDPRRDAGSI